MPQAPKVEMPVNEPGLRCLARLIAARIRSEGTDGVVVPCEEEVAELSLADLSASIAPEQSGCFRIREDRSGALLVQ